MHENPTREHEWLQKLVGEWTCESECQMGPGQPPMKTTGTESVRSLGGFWTLGEGTMGTGEGVCKSLMSLGFDSRTQRFVGTFIASMMSHLWPYNGTLDSAGKVLTLDSEGPSITGDGSLAKYQDIIEFVDDNHRILSSRFQLPDGNWQHFMTAHYHRTTSA